MDRYFIVFFSAMADSNNFPVSGNIAVDMPDGLFLNRNATHELIIKAMKLENGTTIHSLSITSIMEVTKKDYNTWKEEEMKFTMIYK